jgi:hypothetical protein
VRTKTKLIIVGVVLLLLPLLPPIGDAWRAAIDAKTRQAVAEALKRTEAERPFNALASKSTESGEIDDEPEEAGLSIRQQKALAFMIDGEAGSEPIEGKKAVAFVALGRKKDNRPYWGGNDLVKVICKRGKDKDGRVRWQFDGAKAACERNFAGKPSDEGMDIAGKVLIGEYTPTEEQSRWRYFFNQYESGRNGATSLLCETKIGRTVGSHIFAEPKSATKTCLWRKKHQRHKKPTLVASKSKPAHIRVVQKQ